MTLRHQLAVNFSPPYPHSLHVQGSSLSLCSLLICLWEASSQSSILGHLLFSLHPHPPVNLFVSSASNAIIILSRPKYVSPYIFFELQAHTGNCVLHISPWPSHRHFKWNMSHLLLLSLSFALQSAPFWCSSFLVTLVLELLLTFASLLIQFIDKSYWFHFQNPLILVSHTPFSPPPLMSRNSFLPGPGPLHSILTELTQSPLLTVSLSSLYKATRETT